MDILELKPLNFPILICYLKLYIEKFLDYFMFIIFISGLIINCTRTQSNENNNMFIHLKNNFLNNGKNKSHNTKKSKFSFGSMYIVYIINLTQRIIFHLFYKRVDSFLIYSFLECSNSWYKYNNIARWSFRWINTRGGLRVWFGFPSKYLPRFKS